MGRVLVQLPGTTTAKALTETLSKNVIIVDEDLHQLRLHDGSTAGGHLIGNSAGSGVPVGTIIPFAGNSVPQGYLLCDGSAISRTTYASLFAVIGTIYGAGDGSTTFNLPNLVNRVPMRRTTTNVGGVEDGYVPNIVGTLKTTGSLGQDQRSSTSGGTGALTSLETSNAFNYGSGGRQAQTNGISFDASRSNPAYINDNLVIPRNLNIGGWVVKYI